MHSLVSERSRIPLLVLAALAVVVLVAPFPGESLSVAVTRLLGSAGSKIAGVSSLSDGVLVILAVCTVAALVWVWRRAPEQRRPTAFAAIGVVVAFVVSEGAKLMFAQPRPCTRWPIASECPAMDFSLPSNHATLAFGALLVITVATRTLAVTVVASALALIVGIGRMLEGVHYFHDVAAGALLGLAIPAALTAMAGAKWRKNRGNVPNG
ncbi:MAG: phosphatase PAP2 family protein [Microbacterium sp.]|nr:phosphatase PAP2 family protein [Microbacterium sp.]